jgi:5-methylthioadenosine/S-adenosylhomocysteine deaminase
MLVADGPGLEKLSVGGEQRVLYLKQDTEDPDVAALRYADAQAKLADALQNIKAIRLEQEARHGPEALAAEPSVQAGHPRLALDEFEHTEFTQRPHLPLDGAATGPLDAGPETPVPISSLLSPIDLDALTVADDAGWLDRVAAEVNLPAYLAPGLRALYGA